MLNSLKNVNKVWSLICQSMSYNDKYRKLAVVKHHTYMFKLVSPYSILIVG